MRVCGGVRVYVCLCVCVCALDSERADYATSALQCAPIKRIHPHHYSTHCVVGRTHTHHTHTNTHRLALDMLGGTVLSKLHLVFFYLQDKTGTERRRKRIRSAEGQEWEINNKQKQKIRDWANGKYSSEKSRWRELYAVCVCVCWCVCVWVFVSSREVKGIINFALPTQ